MIALTLKAGALLFGLMLTALTVTQAASHDAAHHAAVRRLLLPPADCEAPCLMGLQPDKTHSEAAFAQLNRQGWEAIGGQGYPRANSGTSLWRWQLSAATWTEGQFQAERGELIGIFLTSNLPLSEVWRHLGPPTETHFVWLSDERAGGFMSYADLGWRVEFETACVGDPFVLFQQRVRLIMDGGAYLRQQESGHTSRTFLSFLHCGITP